MHKWGKIGSSHLLNENGDLSFLFYFLKQCLVENVQGKFQKIPLVTFISEESPIISNVGYMSSFRLFKAVALCSNETFGKSCKVNRRPSVLFICGWQSLISLY